jgi:hypothetical protein
MPTPGKPVDVLGMLKKKEVTAGGKTVTSTTAVVAAKPAAPVVLSKEAEPIGKDEVVFEKEVLLRAPTPRVHSVKVTHLSSRDQVYPFLTECSCQFQARSLTEDNAIMAAEQHLLVNAPGGEVKVA